MQIAMLRQVPPKGVVAILDVGATGHNIVIGFAWMPIVLALESNPWKPLVSINGLPLHPANCVP